MKTETTTLGVYGAAINLRTDSDLLARTTKTLIHDIPAQGHQPTGDPRDLVLHAVADPGELPRRSPEAEILVSQPLDAVGDAAGLDGNAGPGPDEAEPGQSEAGPSEADQSEAGEWTVSREGGRILIELTRGVLAFDGTGSAEAWILQPAHMAPEELDGYLFMALTEQLRHSGLYPLHAAALERDGVGIVVPAPSGSGKTTCMLALLDAGWRCLSDDHPLYRVNGDGIELLPFPRPIKITADTLARFPALSRQPLREETYKLALDPEHLDGRWTSRPCRPALLLFPHVIDWPHSSVETLPRSRALEEIMRLGLLVLDRGVAAAQFQALGRMVREAACYRLLFGSDMTELPAVIDSALAGLP